ncbi:MFS transporter [Brevibacillus daliensis]|uniref:MFS transporter n=1 Tax=Brevibacillus daliensis TaxID=2892995 RepID=UPI001E3DC92C|nr:MFS transporter [Brevibacillus daliensis]
MNVAVEPQSKVESLWKNRIYTKLLSSYAISSFGNWFDYIALIAIITFQWKATPMLIALLTVCYAIPSILFSQLAGVLADRVDKRKLMIICTFFRAILTFCLLLASNVYILYGLILIRSTLDVFNLPAEQSLTRQVVADEQLLKATSLNTMVMHMSKIIGPLLGAAILAISSSVLCLIVNGFSLLLSCLILISIGSIKKQHKANPQEIEMDTTDQAKGNSGTSKQESESLMTSWKAGWAVVLGNKTLLVSLIFMLIAAMAIQFVDSQMSVLIREINPNKPEWLGWGIALFGLGAVSMIGVLNRLSGIKRYGLAMGGSAFLIGVSFLALGSIAKGVSFWLVIIPCLIGGAGSGLWSVMSNYLFMNEAPKDAIGRVMGIVQSMGSAVWLIAPLIGGGVVTMVGPHVAFQLSGILVIVLGLSAIIFQSWLWPQRPEDAGNPDKKMDEVKSVMG